MEVTFSSYNYSRNHLRVPATQLNSDMMKEQVQRPGAHLRLERRLAVRELQDIGQALAILAETKSLIDERPHLLSVILPQPSETVPEVAPFEPATAEAADQEATD